MITLFIKNILNNLSGYAPQKELLRRLRLGQFPIDLDGPSGFFLALIIQDLRRESKAGITVVMPTEQEADMLVGDLKNLDIQAELFPWHHVLPYRGFTVSNTVSGQRCRVLSEISENGQNIIVTLRTCCNVGPSISRFLPVPPFASTAGGFHRPDFA